MAFIGVILYICETSGDIWRVIQESHMRLDI